MGKTAALGLKLLWTMGCPPTKVNTQTTHSCPFLKQHTYTHTAMSILLLFPSCLQGCVSFFRISDFWTYISCWRLMGDYVFFFFLIFIFLATSLFSLKRTHASAHTFLLLTHPPTHSHTWSFECTYVSFSLNLIPHCHRSRQVVVSTACISQPVSQEYQAITARAGHGTCR